MIQVAQFSEPGDAALAADFLIEHGIDAVAAPTPYSSSGGMASSTGAVGETPVLVKSAQAGAARALLQSVLAGEFANEGSSPDARARLGAELARVILPDPAFRPPTRLAMLAPLFVIAAVPVLVIVVVIILRGLWTQLG